MSRGGRFAAVAAAVLLALGAAGCDWMVDGEGVLPATIVGPGEPFGSAVVLVTGEGVMAVEGDAGTRIVSLDHEDGSVRAVVIQPESGGSLQFRIRVRDRSASLPSIRVVQVADVENRALDVTERHRALIGR